MTLVLQADGVIVRRGGRVLLRGFDLALPPGAAVQLSGANGAGKTSLLRVLAGLLPPAAGRISRPESLHFLPVADGLKPALTVGETLEIMADWHGVPRAAVSLAATLLGLDPLRARPVRLLSTGQRRRLSLAPLALAPAPLWLLDEPTLGLDGDGLDALARLAAAARGQGTAILLASHQPLPLAGLERREIGGGV